MSTFDELDFEDKLDRYQQRLEADAWQAERRSYFAAARPDAEPLDVPAADVIVGDFITADGFRWAEVVALRGPCSHVRNRNQAVADGCMSITFEIPEPVTVSGETRYIVDRRFDEPITVDATTGREPSPTPYDGPGRDPSPTRPDDMSELGSDVTRPDSVSVIPGPFWCPTCSTAHASTLSTNHGRPACPRCGTELEEQGTGDDDPT